MARFCGFWLCVLGVWVFLGLVLGGRGFVVCLLLGVCLLFVRGGALPGWLCLSRGVQVCGGCVKCVCLVVRCFLWVVV